MVTGLRVGLVRCLLESRGAEACAWPRRTVPSGCERDR